MPDLKTSDFDFELPSDRIAQTASEPRDHAKLLHVDGSLLSDHHVFDLPALLRAGDLLVLNDTRVIPARLFGTKGAMRVEILLLKKIAAHLTPSGVVPEPHSVIWRAFARPGKRLQVGDDVSFTEGVRGTLLEKHDGGEVSVRFPLDDAQFLNFLHTNGEPPLPPYIKTHGNAKDQSERYQTVYATRDGAVAAPTAGLHFTPALLDALKRKGVETVTVTLHVGAGTFLPVKSEYIKDHKMHAEYGEISKTAADTLNRAHLEGRRIVCVGTTSLRVLESAANEKGNIRPYAQETSIFISPGYRFRVVDALITNFHLPQSTLFMLVCAFAGMDTMKAAYRYAIEHDYRFYSFGDTSLLERS